MPCPVTRHRRDTHAAAGQPAIRVAARHALSVLVHVAEPGRGIDRDAVFAAVRHWYATHLGERPGLADDFEDAPQRKRITARQRRDLADALRGLCEPAGKPARARAGVDGIARLARILGLTPLDAQILRVIVLYRSNNAFEELVDSLATRVFRSPPSLRADPALFGLLTGQPEDEVAPRLRRDGDLAASGLVLVEECGNIRLLNRVLGIATSGFTDDAAVVDAILGRKLEATLEIADFAHLGADVERVRKILAGALAAGEGGCILFAGVSGAGKTELAKTLAAALATPIYAIGQHDMRGNEPSAVERLSDLALAQRLFAKSRGTNRALLLVDEAEDLWGGGGGVFDMMGGQLPDPLDERHGRAAGRSRAYLHALLENSKVPMILTCNDIGALGGGPFLRRMTCIVSFGVPPLDVRRRLVRHAANAEGIGDMGPAHVEALARMAAGPAIARSALRAARLAGDPEVAIWAATGVAQAMRGAGRAGAVPAYSTDDFDPGLIRADVDLAALAGRLSASGASRRFSLLLSGPPGSGKSAFARHLADRLGMPVLERRTSDLLSKFVGGSERLIAQAFAEAAAGEAMLIFDEADSLLRSRAGAAHGWEISQVNEMLTGIERHAWPIVATTNMLDDIDGAAMRRFLVKANFGYLEIPQRARAFVVHFGISPPAGLDALDALTPADFALVKRRAALEGFAGDPEALLAALAAEQAAKPERRHGTTKVGFVG
jgi:tRNA A37 threonylcarbamoyladenosine biosynthesis protein TsaE